MQNIYGCLCPFGGGLERGGRKMGFLECTALWGCKQVRGLGCADSGPVSVLPAGFAGSLRLLPVRPLRIVITTCYWSTQCTSVSPHCPSWLLVTTVLLSEVCGKGHRIKRTLHLTGRPRAATPWDWPRCSVTKGDHKGPVQRRREKGNQGLRFI